MAKISAYYRQRPRSICTEHCFAKKYSVRSTFFIGASSQRAFFNVDEFSLRPIFLIPATCTAWNVGRVAKNKRCAFATHFMFISKTWTEGNWIAVAIVQPPKYVAKFSRKFKKFWIYRIFWNRYFKETSQLDGRTKNKLMNSVSTWNVAAQLLPKRKQIQNGWQIKLQETQLPLDATQHCSFLVLP